MEFKNTLEIVTKDIQDIEKLVSNFKNYSRIPNIELDLALSRLRNVYDLLLMFREDTHANTHKPAHKSGREVTAAPPENGKPAEQKPAPLNSATPPVNETVTTASPETFEETVATLVKPEDPAIPVAPEKTSTRKKPVEDKIFIHEKLGKHAHKKDITSKLQAQGIKSIAGSLGINDKFFFIRELFAGNTETFRQTMEELDNSHNFNDAYSLLMGKFQWDMDSEPVQTLLNLIRRKFITSGNE
jgi:hypothetical protein